MLSVCLNKICFWTLFLGVFLPVFEAHRREGLDGDAYNLTGLGKGGANIGKLKKGFFLKKFYFSNLEKPFLLHISIKWFMLVIYYRWSFYAVNNFFFEVLITYN